MSDVAVIANTAVAIIAVVVMIVRFKFNPVVSLVVGSAYLGLAVGLGVEKTIEAITTGFGDIMAEVGLLIAFGVLMGAILQQTGAIQRLVQALLKVFGPKRMPYAMSLTIATCAPISAPRRTNPEGSVPRSAASAASYVDAAAKLSATSTSCAACAAAASGDPPTEDPS